MWLIGNKAIHLATEIEVPFNIAKGYSVHINLGKKLNWLKVSPLQFALAAARSQLAFGSRRDILWEAPQTFWDFNRRFVLSGGTLMLDSALLFKDSRSTGWASSLGDAVGWLYLTKKGITPTHGDHFFAGTGLPSPDWVGEDKQGNLVIAESKGSGGSKISNFWREKVIKEGHKSQLSHHFPNVDNAVPLLSGMDVHRTYSIGAIFNPGVPLEIHVAMNPSINTPNMNPPQTSYTSTAAQMIFARSWLPLTRFMGLKNLVHALEMLGIDERVKLRTESRDNVRIFSIGGRRIAFSKRERSFGFFVWPKSSEVNKDGHTTAEIIRLLSPKFQGFSLGIDVRLLRGLASLGRDEEGALKNLRLIKEQLISDASETDMESEDDVAFWVDGSVLASNNYLANLREFEEVMI